MRRVVALAPAHSANTGVDVLGGQLGRRPPIRPQRSAKIERKGKARVEFLLFLIALIILLPFFHLRAEEAPTGVFGDSFGLGISESGSLAFSNSLASTELSTGVARAHLPFMLNSARGDVQPELGLYYSSVTGNREVGTGWSLNLPAIERKNLSGAPTYQDPPVGEQLDASKEDRFVFAGEPLVPICYIRDGQCSKLKPDEVPPWAGSGGWHYFRLQTEGSFLRFFWSPDHRTWRVQAKSGETIEFGVPLTISGDDSSVDIDGLGVSATGRIYRWNLARRYDSQGAEHPSNVIVYRWAKLGKLGLGYLTDIYDTPTKLPNSDALDFANHTKLLYEPHQFPDISHALIWRATPDLRLKRVDVTSSNFANVGPRELVRRYHLTYDTAFRHSWLRSVQMEGRCQKPIGEFKGLLPDKTGCPRLPPTTLQYSRPSLSLTSWTLMKGAQPTPALSDAWARTVLIDINSDGLPDFVAPAYVPGQPQSVYFNSPGTEADTIFGAPCRTPEFTGCPADLFMLSPTLGANPTTLLSRSYGQSILGDWNGEGTVGVLWNPLRESYTIYVPRLLSGTWLWSGGNVLPGALNADQATDVNGDGLTDLIDTSQGQFILVALTQKSADGHVTVPPGNVVTSTNINHEFEPASTADVNGDGIPDLVMLGYRDVSNDDLIEYYLGDGLGHFGACERQKDGQIFCRASGFMRGAPPRESRLSNTYLHDVNGDGLADLIQTSDAGVTIRFNIDGNQFGPPNLVVWPFPTRGTTGSAGDQPLTNYSIAFADMNGSGVDDVVLLAEGRPIYYFDLYRGERPGLLIDIANGLGATAHISYENTPTLARTARGSGAPWDSQSPQVLHAVTSIATANNVPGGQLEKHLTEYSYRDPVYDGWERRFRGFRTVRVTEPGDGTAPVSTTETTFLLGTCVDISVPCGNNVDENHPLKYLNGKPALVETFGGLGTYLSTKHWEYRLIDVYEGMDGRKVRFAAPSRVDTYLYDADNFDGKAEKVVLFDAQGESLGSNPPRREIVLRSTAGRAHVRAETDIDLFGNESRRVDFGRIRDDGSPIDLPIERLNNYELIGNNSWLWRLKESNFLPFPKQKGVPRGITRKVIFLYDSVGNVTDIAALLIGTHPLDRFHEDSSKAIAPAPSAAARDGLIHLFRGDYDGSGNLIRAEGPTGECGSFSYDDAYNQLLIEKTVFTAGCDKAGLATRFVYDRGLALITETVAPGGMRNLNHFDGFGRLIDEYGPDPKKPGATTSLPETHIEYSIRTNGPLQWIQVLTRDASANGYRDGWLAVDGFGKKILAFRESDKSAGDSGRWIVSGLVRRSTKGLIASSYPPQFYDGNPSSFPFKDYEAQPHLSFVYDPFGRVSRLIGLDRTLAHRYDYHALSQDSYDAADLERNGSHFDTPVTSELDGHGRVVAVFSRIRTSGILDTVTSRYTYLATGEPVLVSQEHSQGPERIVRWLMYDSLGRLAVNAEPNTARNFVADPDNAESIKAMKAWRYVYDDSGRLVGTSDARGCGENFHYDGAGRLIAEDYSPCRLGQPDYSPPDLTNGTGAEVFYRYDAPEPGQTSDFGENVAFLAGRLVAVMDRGAHSRYAYDGRGRITGIARRIAKPGSLSISSLDRYSIWWFRTRTIYDDADRVSSQTTGADVPELLGSDGASKINIQYTDRGLVRSINGSYGTLLAGQLRAADSVLLNFQLGDAARSFAQYQYDDRRRLSTSRFLRNKQGPWVKGQGYVPPPTGDQPTLQRVLQDWRFQYDAADNITVIQDRRDRSEWPVGARPQSRTMAVDDLYRVTQVIYDSGGDVQVSPFAPEITKGDPAPVPELLLSNRVQSQSILYSWNGNIRETDDDSQAFYDRSLGSMVNGNELDKPNQLLSAALGGAKLTAEYDAGGNLVNLVVVRTGSCSDPGGRCTQRYDYDWDEVGRLMRARRWDYVTIPPDEPTFPSIPRSPPTADLQYAYSNGHRVLRSTKLNGESAVHSIDIFPTLQLSQAPFDNSSSTYLRTPDTEIVYPTSFAQIVYSSVPLPSVYGKRQHLLFRVSDHLGSTSTIIDKDTSELVEQVTYQAYGFAASDYRPGRWHGFRHQYRFSGKMDDFEVGLLYFGARYFHPLLNRWISPDPLTIHMLGSDLNPFAYVGGSPMHYVDVVGLQGSPCYGAEWEGACAGADGPSGSGGGSDGGWQRGPGGSPGSPRGSGGSDPYNHGAAASGPFPTVYHSCYSCWLVSGYNAGFGQLGEAWEAGIPQADKNFWDTGKGLKDSLISGLQGMLAAPKLVGGPIIWIKDWALGGDSGSNYLETLKTPKEEQNARYTAGTTLGTIGMAILPVGGLEQTLAAENIAKPFAMGLEAAGLDAFAEARGATTWKSLADPLNWRSGVIEKLADPNTIVHFNLDGVDVWAGVSRASSGVPGRFGATDWELLQIQQNPQWWETIQFWKNGSPAPNPFKR